MSKKAVGQVPDGWSRQGLQVPDQIAERFKYQANRAGVGGVKALGTAALALITEMPEDLRFALMRRAAQDTWPEPKEFNANNMWRMFVALVMADCAEKAELDEKARGRIGWYVDRILDPEVTPPPGKKASDRGTGEQRGRTKEGA